MSRKNVPLEDRPFEELTDEEKIVVSHPQWYSDPDAVSSDETAVARANEPAPEEDSDTE